MIISINNNPVIGVTPMYTGKIISVAIDSSKRNSAITIGDEWCEPLDVIEFDGKNDGTSEKDVLELAKRHRDTLKVILQGAVVKYAGIEDIITVEKTSKTAGLEQHQSRFKITAVFMSFISFLQDNFGITPMLINNKTWKSMVLPEEFTRANVYKGSLQYYKSIGSKYGDYSDDATDSLCILKFMKIVNDVKKVVVVGEPEICTHKYDYYISRVVKRVSEKCVPFVYNSNLSVTANVEAFITKIKKGEIGYAKVPISVFDVATIFERSSGSFENVTDEVYLVAVRRS